MSCQRSNPQRPFIAPRLGGRKPLLTDEQVEYVLTGREIMHAVARKYSMKAMAHALGLDEKTLRNNITQTALRYRARRRIDKLDTRPTRCKPRKTKDQHA